MGIGFRWSTSMSGSDSAKVRRNIDDPTSLKIRRMVFVPFPVLPVRKQVTLTLSRVEAASQISRMTGTWVWLTDTTHLKFRMASTFLPTQSASPCVIHRRIVVLATAAAVVLCLALCRVRTSIRYRSLSRHWTHLILTAWWVSNEPMSLRPVQKYPRWQKNIKTQ
jgi:hypothetical protein